MESLLTVNQKLIKWRKRRKMKMKMKDHFIQLQEQFE